jgi:hypothetical protein
MLKTVFDQLRQINKETIFYGNKRRQPNRWPNKYSNEGGFALFFRGKRHNEIIVIF